jgi:TPR repeat protein
MIMKTKLTIVAFVLLLLATIGLTTNFHTARGHDPRDLSYWSQVGATRDWSAAAAQGDRQAQFLYGLALVRTNLQTMIDRVPRLSGIPVIGKRFFETISYGIDGRIGREQLAEAYRWIKLSADQGFAPAKEAEKLFVGRIGLPNRGGPATGSQPMRPETNGTSATAGSRR